MKDYIAKRLTRQDGQAGVAMITVIVLSAVLMVIGGGMYFVAAREQTMTNADNLGGQAFYYAEGGIENVLDILSYAATETQLTRLRTDQSPDGGYLMDPDPALRQNPPNPLEMSIGQEDFSVWVDLVDQNGAHCTTCGLSFANPVTTTAHVLITAEGRSGSGYRKMEQMVQLDATGFPMHMYIDGDAVTNGNTTITDQSIYVKGNFYGRNKLTLSGSDLIYGGSAGVKATSTIYYKGKSEHNAHRSYIYKDNGLPNSPTYWKANFINDRDSRGPVANTFSLDELENSFNLAGLSQSQLDRLKRLAQSSGYYRSASGNLTINQSDLPNRDGDVIVYVEFPNGSPENNTVKPKFTWPLVTGKAMIVVLNGNIDMNGNDVGSLTGSIYCPDGGVRADGAGGGNFIGTVWGKGFIDIGNFDFDMTTAFLDDPPMFAWTISRETRWTQVDR